MQAALKPPTRARQSPSRRRRPRAASSADDGASTSAPTPPHPPPQPPPPLPIELRFCTNKTCRRQGAASMAKLARDLAIPGLTVTEAGCLGRCGAGPNAAVLPGGGEPPVVVAGLGTPARLVEILSLATDADIPAGVLAATEARLAGNAAARDGDWAGAEGHYTRGLSGPAPCGPAAAAALHANRSAARLARGDVQGALADADAAVALVAGLPGPAGTSARVRQAEARASAGDAAGAAASLAAAVAGDPAFKDADTLGAALEAKAAAAVARAA